MKRINNIVVPDVEIVLNIDEGVEIEATTIFD